MQLACSKTPRGLVPYRYPALVVGHPGHELKLFGWLSQNHPRLFVLTDGSGHHGASRLASTARLVSEIKGEKGSVFGFFSDLQIYRAILNRNVDAFLSIVDRMAESFLEFGVDFVAGDAAEGFNPTHDLCRQLIDGAVLKAQRMASTQISNFEFCLTESERNRRQRHDSRCLHFVLDDALLDRKLQSAFSYAELKDEVSRAIASRGKEYFRVECLRAVRAFSQEKRGYKPFYEAVGEDRVASGKYHMPIRYRLHVLPILRAIRKHVEQTTGKKGWGTHQPRAQRLRANA